MKSALDKTDNRTGMGVAPPQLVEQMLETTEMFRPALSDEGEAAAAVRITYAEKGEPAGSLPPPKAAQGRRAAQTPLQPQQALLMDKLGERLAFERSGVRLYDALLSKLEAYGSWEGGPTREQLEHIRDEEREHFHLLERTIEEQGGDPTAVTPSANVHGVASMGLPAVLADPRTDLQQSLEAILVAELVDNDCWQTLTKLATAAGLEQAANGFATALEQEREHLTLVRGWLAAGTEMQASGRASPRYA
jgi:rubrerythrin